MQTQRWCLGPELGQRLIDELNALRLWTVPYRDLNARFQDVRELLPEAQARRFRAVVLEATRDKLRVGMADPTELRFSA